MPSAFVSPGAYTLERDFSLYVPSLATAIYGIVLTASKGPINERVLITDEGALRSRFGNPSATHLGLHAAIRYLRHGEQLWVVRVGTYYAYADDLPVLNEAGTATAITLTIPEDIGPGTWANSVAVVIAAGVEAGTYNISVTDGGFTVEKYDRIKIGPTEVDDQNYITTRINSKSNYISITVDDATQATLTTGTYSFSGGLDGAPATNGAIIGSVGAPPVTEPTGLQLFRNPEAIDINLLGVPGNSEAAVIAEIITICEERADCLGLIDVPIGKSVQQAVDWHNGIGGGAGEPLVALDSSYAAAYYPWAQVFDSLANTNVYIPPTGHAAGQIAYNDQVAAPWYSPAGFVRGRLPDVLQLEHSPTQGERDYMYGNGNSLNMMVSFAGRGTVIWGARTLQRLPTAVDHINVRRLLLYMRKAIASTTLILVHEPNDEDTRRRFRNLVEPLCETIKSERGIFDFQVVCDEGNNPAADVADGILTGYIMIQPTITAEKIISRFVLLPQGASFEEFLD